MKSIIVEFNLVLENSRLKEDMGIEQLMFSKCSFNMLDVEYFRESLSADGDAEPYTVVGLETGLILCLDVTYEEFKILFKKAIEKNEQ